MPVMPNYFSITFQLHFMYISPDFEECHTEYQKYTKNTVKHIL